MCLFETKNTFENDKTQYIFLLNQPTKLYCNGGDHICAKVTPIEMTGKVREILHIKYKQSKPIVFYNCGFCSLVASSNFSLK